jgi:hypothetical protein
MQIASMTANEASASIDDGALSASSSVNCSGGIDHSLPLVTRRSLPHREQRPGYRLKSEVRPNASVTRWTSAAFAPTSAATQTSQRLKGATALIASKIGFSNIASQRTAMPKIFVTHVKTTRIFKGLLCRQIQRLPPKV